MTCNIPEPENLWHIASPSGVFGYGKTLAEAMEDITGAATVHAGTLIRLGQPVPAELHELIDLEGDER